MWKIASKAGMCINYAKYYGGRGGAAGKKIKNEEKWISKGEGDARNAQYIPLIFLGKVQHIVRNQVVAPRAVNCRQSCQRNLIQKGNICLFKLYFHFFVS